MPPIFEYECAECGARTERVRKFEQRDNRPLCFHEEVTLPMRRIEVSRPGFRRDHTVVELSQKGTA